MILYMITSDYVSEIIFMSDNFFHSACSIYIATAEVGDTFCAPMVIFLHLNIYFTPKTTAVPRMFDVPGFASILISFPVIFCSLIFQYAAPCIHNSDTFIWRVLLSRSEIGTKHRVDTWSPTMGL